MATIIQWVLFGAISVIIIVCFIVLIVKIRQDREALYIYRLFDSFGQNRAEIIADVSRYCTENGITEHEFWKKLEDAIMEKEAEEVKDICRGENISGFRDCKTVRKLVSELKCDALEWRAKYQGEYSRAVSLERELKIGRAHV